MRKKKAQKKRADRSLLNVILLLTAFGLVAVASASMPQALNAFGDRYYFFRQQLLWGLIGIAVMLATSAIDYRFWKNMAIPFFVVSIIMLILVLIPGLGSKVLGARRWLVLGPIRFQPSELVKFTLALYFARLSLSDKKLIAYLLPLVAIVALIMLQPDLGTTLVVVAIGFSQIIVSGVSFIKIMGIIAGGVVLSAIAILSSGYRRDRLMTFFAQSQDPLGKSYHIRQILLALGSGGWFGVGLGASRQKYLFLPEAATDSIFAVVAEEIGFVGSMLIILVFAFFVYRALLVVKKAPDPFARMLALGIVTWIASQILLNLGSMLALVPLTGVPLPFFSYGGTALTMILAACGILLNISKHGYDQKISKR